MTNDITGGGEALEKAALNIGADPELIKAFSLIEQDARALLESANLMADAVTGEQLSQALDHNLKLWVVIKTMVGDPANALPEEVKANLRQLADFVTGVTLGAGQGRLDDAKVQQLIAIDMHIAEGLTRGQQDKLIRDRAHQIWDREGRPEGKAEEHWRRAEQEVAALLATPTA